MQTAAVQIRYTPSPPDSPKGPGGVDLGTRAGTGFFISAEGYLLTAGHVIRESNKAVMDASHVQAHYQIGMLIGPRPDFIANFRFVEATVVDVDDVHDLALLKLSKNPFKGEVVVPKQFGGVEVPFTVTAARLDVRRPAEGETLLVSGYPLQIPTFVSQRGMVASESFTYVDYATLAPEAVHPPGLPGEPIFSILLDAVINPGNSGGPVYDSTTGDVVGVCEAYAWSPLLTNKGRFVPVQQGEILTQNSGLAVVTPIEYAITLLRKNNISSFSVAKKISDAKH
jgi:S1-C subfamily serine protease